VQNIKIQSFLTANALRLYDKQLQIDDVQGKKGYPLWGSLRCSVWPFRL